MRFTEQDRRSLKKLRAAVGKSSFTATTGENVCGSFRFWRLMKLGKINRSGYASGYYEIAPSP